VRPGETRPSDENVSDPSRWSEVADKFFRMNLELLCIADHEGYFRYLNPLWERILGHSQEELKGQPYLHYVHPEDRESTLRQAAGLAEPNRVINFENRYSCSDGSWRWLSWTAVSDGEFIYAVARDVTERAVREEEIRAAQLEAEAASTAKSSFLAGMSHELRTPLNAIIGFSELLADETFGKLNPKQTRYMHNILSSGRHLLSLINDVLDISKIEAGHMELDIRTVDAHSALQEVLVSLESLRQDKNISVSIPEMRRYSLSADPSKLRQILLNLVGNALKFTPEGGRVDIDLLDSTLVPNGNSGWITVRIRDTGIGIEPEHQMKIFDRFEQVDSSFGRQHQGTGLGLSLSKSLVELQGGSIWVESEGEGKGSCFSFSLPGNERSEEPINNGRPCILMVEDNLMAQELLGHYLRENGYEPVPVGNGEEALRLSRVLAPQAITLDVCLGGRMDGWEVLARLKADPQTREIPVIMVTMTDEKARGFNLGASDFFVKPLEKGGFVERLRVLAPVGQDGRVLVIDDDPSIRERMKFQLQKQGYEVFLAEGGSRGVELALSEKPDVIVLDLLMPGVNGFETVTRLRAHSETRDIPIIIFTALDITREQRNVLNCQIQAVAQKSNMEELFGQLRSFITGGKT
jgi:PAS domain S-box-containing protein